MWYLKDGIANRGANYGSAVKRGVLYYWIQYVLFYLFFEAGAQYVVQAGLEFMILLS